MMRPRKIWSEDTFAVLKREHNLNTIKKRGIHRASEECLLSTVTNEISAKENGELLTPYSFKYCSKVIHKELGNPLFHIHCLRHTHGTLLAENVAQPKTVMERLGHKDIKTTMDRYVFNTEKMQNNAMAILADAIS